MYRDKIVRNLTIFEIKSLSSRAELTKVSDAVEDTDHGPLGQSRLPFISPWKTGEPTWKWGKMGTKPEFGGNAKRFDALDGIRFVAAFAVTLVHAMPSAFPGGWVGVDVFFVISGYIITNQLLQEEQKRDTINYPYFLYRRLVRLYPALIAVCVIYTIFIMYNSLPFRHFWGIITSLLYVSDFSRSFGWGTSGFMGHSWTLSIEWKFYLIFPIILIALKSARYRVICIALLCISIFAWRLYLTTTEAASIRIANGFDTRLDPILIGSLAAFFPLERLRPHLVVVAGAAAFLLAVTLFAPFDAPWVLRYGYTLISVASLVLLIGVLTNRFAAAAFSSGLFALGGQISYSIYLWHVPLLEMLKYHNVAHAGLWMLAMIFPISYLSWRVFEIWPSRFKSVETYHRLTMIFKRADRINNR